MISEINLDDLERMANAATQDALLEKSLNPFFIRSGI